MLSDPFHQRLPQLLSVPPELLAYERWLQAERRVGLRDYLFSEDRARFEPRKEDIVVALPGLRVVERRGKTRIAAEQASVDVELDGVGKREAQRVIAAIDGKRSLLEVRWHSGVTQDVLARFLRSTFGRVVMAPRAVEALETELPGVEISRFPAAPYGIERPYWENMIAVRQYFLDKSHALGEVGGFISLLRELHVLTLMGKTLESFYRPASPVADEIVAPGFFYLNAPRLLHGPSGVIYLDGPRVRVPLLGGERYHRMLCASVGDEAALDDARAFEEDGVAWGNVVTARSEREEQPVPLFCPPRPMHETHFEALRSELAAALAADGPEAALRGAARFHQRFVRLHPFHCANQSLAMNLVNAVLARHLGAGIPHLVLDHLALRLSSDAYMQVFRRAVDAYAIVDANPVRRLAELMERKRRFFALIEHVSQGGATSDDADAARWALLDGMSAPQ